MKRTSDSDPLTLLGFTGRVGAHAIVRSLLLRSHLCDLVGRLQFVRGVVGDGALFSVVPGEEDGHRASMHRAHQRHVLPLGDVPHVGHDSQHRLRHRFCKQNSCWAKVMFVCLFPSALASNIPINFV